jgi:hypothetical protein
MAADPAAGRRRGLLLALDLLTILGWALVSGPWHRLLSAPIIGHALAAVLVFWLALRAAAHSVQAIYGLESLGEAQRFVWRAAFGGRTSKLNIHGGEVDFDNAKRAVVRVGGPAQVRLALENAAVFESAQAQPRVMAPSERPQHISGFERLRTVLDLRDQVLNLTLWARTRDGVRVQIEGARVVYSVQRGEQESSLGSPHPFQRQAALRLVYEQQMDAPRARARQANPLTSSGQRFFEQQLQDYVGQFNLGELIATPHGEDTKSSAQLFLARDRIRLQFMSRVALAAVELGLQLHWMDIGTWTLPRPAQELLEAHQEDLEPEPVVENPYQDSRQAQLLRLFESLPIWRLDLANPREAIGSTISGYATLFGQLIDRFDEMNGEDELHFDAVRRFLGVLSARLGGPSGSG